jgi:hypothetical protein
MIGPTNIMVQPDHRGAALALSWTTPMLPGFLGTQVLRRELEFPVAPPDVRNSQNVVLDDRATPAGHAGQFLDTALKGETTYYYAIVAYDSAFRPFPAFISAMTTAPYRTAAYLYRNLPEIYRSSDTATSQAVFDPADAGKGQLLRLMEIFGSELDLLRSYAGGMRTFRDPNQIDGRLLTWLAEWIGWQTNYNAPINRQRSDVKFAPKWYATIGIAANLRAGITGVVGWDAKFKEFEQNVFLSNRPEELPVYELQRLKGVWGLSTNVSLDVAYEGRPSAVLAADGRPWIFYHARQAAAGGAPDRWQVWCKVWEQGQWLAARRVTSDAALNRWPVAVRRGDGSVMLFWSGAVPDTSGRFVPRLRTQLLSIGRTAQSARLQGTAAAPFALADGDTFRITVGMLECTVTLHPEAFVNIAQATAAETASALDRELPGVGVTATAAGTIAFMSQAMGAAAQLTFPASPVGAKLGITANSSATGADAAPAQITGTRTQPFALAMGDILVITIDNGVARTVPLDATQTTAAQVAAAINAVLPGIATSTGGGIQLTSLQKGASSQVFLDVDLSSAAAKLGFAAAVPAAAPLADDTEASAFADAAGNIWLFWSSRRSAQWQIWYSRFDATAWGAPRLLTPPPSANALPAPDREPFAVFDPATPGRIWVCWSRQKANGLWNIFIRTTTKLDFNSLAETDWTEFEMRPVSPDYDNRDAAAVVPSSGNLDLYFASNRGGGGWKIWSKTITPTTQGADTAITSGQFTHRGPFPLDVAKDLRLLFLRGNDSIVYDSKVYTGTLTIDSRYVGSTTIDARNTARKDVRTKLDDIVRYTYEASSVGGQEANRRYSRDTVGVFLTPDTTDQGVVDANIALISSAVSRFLPIQIRTVFVTK